MIVHVKMNDDYTFIVEWDKGAIELLHQICKLRGLDAPAIMSEILLGGLTMQDHLFLHPEHMENIYKRNRWKRLFNILNIFRK